VHREHERKVRRLAFEWPLDSGNSSSRPGNAATAVLGWLIVSAVASLIAAALLMRFVPQSSSGEPRGEAFHTRCHSRCAVCCLP
jgi:hypothetical protein